MIVGMYMRTYYGNMIELLIYDNTSACTMALIPIVISKVITRNSFTTTQIILRTTTYLFKTRSFFHFLFLMSIDIVQDNLCRRRQLSQILKHPKFEQDVHTDGN